MKLVENPWHANLPIEKQDKINHSWCATVHTAQFHQGMAIKKSCYYPALCIFTQSCSVITYDVKLTNSQAPDQISHACTHPLPLYALSSIHQFLLSKCLYGERQQLCLSIAKPCRWARNEVDYVQKTRRDRQMKNLAKDSNEKFDGSSINPKSKTKSSLPQYRYTVLFAPMGHMFATLDYQFWALSCLFACKEGLQIPNQGMVHRLNVTSISIKIK